MSSPQLPTLWMQVEQLKIILAVFAVTWHTIQWSGQVYCHDLAAQTRKVPEYPQLMYLNAL